MRPIVGAPNLLVTHPLAAGRALERLYGSEPIAPAGLERAHAIQLAPEVRVSEPLEIPARACLEVVAAIGSGASGLELAIGGADGGTISRGRFVVGDRVCAGETASSATAQLRLSAGSSEAIVLTREIPP
jgi:hypothetical protein